MKEEIYVITLLPEDNTLEQLNSVKNFFYANDFKFKRKISTSNSHVTISELIKPQSWDLFEIELRAVLSRFAKIKANVVSVTDEIKITEKYPGGEGWVSLLFDDEHIKKIYLSVEEFLDNNGLSRNKDYVDSIVKLSGKNLGIFDCIANHLNLCNHCRPEKAKEAKDYIENNVPKEIVFDKVVVRNKNSEEEIFRFCLPS